MTEQIIPLAVRRATGLERMLRKQLLARLATITTTHSP